jgi:hypothetical protein
VLTFFPFLKNDVGNDGYVSIGSAYFLFDSQGVLSDEKK